MEKLATSWPFWLCLVIIVALILFRKELSDLIKRVRRIGKDHIDASGSLEQKSQPSADPKQAADELLAQINVNPYHREAQQLLETELKSKNLAIDSETARVLLGLATGLWIAVDFQRIYSIIWGSQIELLNFVNSRTFATAEELQTYYTIAAIQYPDTYASYTFDEYLNFLQSQLLLRVDNGEYRITLKGRSFLLFLVSQGFNQNKPL